MSLSRRLLRLVCAALALIIAFISSWPQRADASSSRDDAIFPPRAFDRIFIIVFENKAQAQVLANPYFNDLAKRGVLLSKYEALTRPSQPNYIAMLGGDLLVRDNRSHNLRQRNLVDLLEDAGISWKAYQEGYPGKCFARGSYRRYTRKHNPFISFDTVRNDSQRCAKIVNATELDADIANDTVPQFAFYTPDMDNSGHDKPLSYAANWLRGFLEPKLTNANFISGTLVMVTFDESIGRNNRIYTALIGPMVRVGRVDATPYDHYSLLRTIEDNFALGSLDRKDATAQPFDACNFVRVSEYAPAASQ